MPQKLEIKLTTDQLIAKLSSSGLYAKCGKCEDSFKLSDALLFDGTKSFPAAALLVRKNMENYLEERKAELAKRKISATIKAEMSAKVVNLGKSLEKVFPILNDFKLELPDCRFLNDPIDFIAFNGFSRGNVKSISFIEVKSGQARLNDHQKSIKDAVEDKRVHYKVF